MLVNKGTGAGGSNTNKTGLTFEKIIIKTLEQELYDKNFSIKNKKLGKYVYKILYNEQNNIVGIFLEQSRIYQFLDFLEIDYRVVISKQYRPDSCFLNFIDQKMYVFEIKNQTGTGSVDEKIQTGDFKKKQFKKISLLFQE